jgi:hypothetical protein
MTKKRGPEKQYASERERNRAKQQRHRDKINSVTLAAKGGEAAAKLSTRVQCTKCNGSAVCAECEKVRDEVFETFSLSVNRATHLARNDITTGGYDAAKVDKSLAAGDLRQHGRSTTHSYTRHEDGKDTGSAVKVGRFTAGKKFTDTLHRLVEISTDKKVVDDAMTNTYMENVRKIFARHLRNRMEFHFFVLKHPNLSRQECFDLFRESPLGKTLWEMAVRGELR